MTDTTTSRQKSFHRELVRRLFDLSVSSFGLVAALAWNEAIKDLVTSYIPEGSTLSARFIYAIVVTLLAVTVIYQIGKLGARLRLEEDQDAQEK